MWKSTTNSLEEEKDHKWPRNHTSVLAWSSGLLRSYIPCVLSNFFSLLQWDNIQRWIKWKYVLLTRIVSLEGTMRWTVIKSYMYQQKILIQWLCDHCIDPLCNVKWHKVSVKWRISLFLYCFFLKMHICMCSCLYVCTPAYVFVFMHVCVQVLMPVCVWSCL